MAFSLRFRIPRAFKRVFSGLSREQPASPVRIVGEVDDRNIDRYELASARRALSLIKGNLGPKRLHSLISEQIREGNAVFRDHVKRSGGKMATGTISLQANNLSSADFSAWMTRAFAREDVLLAAHPEHYLMDSKDPQGPHIVETLNEHVVGFRMGGWEQAALTTDDSESKDKRRSHLALDDDGTIFGFVSTLFRDTDHGMIAELSVGLPVTAPDAIKQHLEHFSVEFRSWMLLAAAETRK